MVDPIKYHSRNELRKKNATTKERQPLFEAIFLLASFRPPQSSSLWTMTKLVLIPQSRRFLQCVMSVLGSFVLGLYVSRERLVRWRRKIMFFHVRGHLAELLLIMSVLKGVADSPRKRLCSPSLWVPLDSFRQVN